MSKYALASISLNGTVIHIKDGSQSNNIKRLTVPLGGTVNAALTAILQESPRFSCSTTDISGFNAAVGITAKSVANAVLGFVAFDSDGQRSSTAASAFAATLTSAFVIPRRISAPDGAEATLSFDVIGISADGTTSPVAYGTTVPSLPTTTGAYTLGPGGTIGNEESVEFDYGIQEDVRFGSGYRYPTFAGVLSQSPSARIRTTDLSKVAVPASGSLTIKLTVLANKGGRGATVITITLAEGSLQTNQVSGSHPGVGSGEVFFQAVDGSGEMLTIAAA